MTIKRNAFSGQSKRLDETVISCYDRPLLPPSNRYVGGRNKMRHNDRITLVTKGSTPDLRSFEGVISFDLSETPFQRPRRCREFPITILRGVITIRERNEIVLRVPEALLNPWFDANLAPISFADGPWKDLTEKQREATKLLLVGAFQLVCSFYNLESEVTTRVLTANTTEELETLELAPVHVAA